MSENKYRAMELDELKLRWAGFNPTTNVRTNRGERVQIKRLFKKSFPQLRFDTGKRGMMIVLLPNKELCLYTKDRIDKVENWGKDDKTVLKMHTDWLWKFNKGSKIFNTSEDSTNWYYVTAELIHAFYNNNQKT